MNSSLPLQEPAFRVVCGLDDLAYLVTEFPGPKKVNLCIIIGLYIYPKKLKVKLRVLGEPARRSRGPVEAAPMTALAPDAPAPDTPAVGVAPDCTALPAWGWMTSRSISARVLGEFLSYAGFRLSSCS